MKRKKPLFSVKEMDIQIKSHSFISPGWREAIAPKSQEIASNELSVRKPSKLFVVIAGFTVILFGLLSWRLFELQVVQAVRYEELANGNRVRERISYAPRGRILDRNGKVLAENILSFQLTVTPYLLDSAGVKRETDFKQMSKLINIETKQLRNLALEEGQDYPLPILVAENIDHKTAIKIEQILPKTPGFSLDEIPSRRYVADAGLAHILGYTGRVSETDLETGSDTLLPVDFIGKAGVEKSYDASLRGQNGQERTEIDALGRPVRLLAQKDPLPGRDIHLTIDYDQQVRLYEAIKKQMKLSKTNRGSGVAVDPNNGEVLAMVSIPTYDNNLFAGGISNAEFARLNNDSLKPLINRTVQAGYSSGSTIKPIVASGALKHGVVTPNTVIVDRGSITVPSFGGGAPFVFRGWRPEGLGPMNIRRAIAWSSNIYFYTVGGGHGGINGLGEERLTALYREFGLGALTGIDLPSEFAGRVPNEQWKLDRTGENWYVGDSYNISIGQGDLLVTPLQLTLANMTVANGGYLLRPQLVHSIGGRQVAERQVRREVSIDKSILDIVREGMRQTLTDGTTCECVFKDTPVEVAGKSGTAQTTSDDTRRPHAWYTAFAPWQTPEIHATVMLEEGSESTVYSAPAINELFNEHFKDQIPTETVVPEPANESQ